MQRVEEADLAAVRQLKADVAAGKLPSVVDVMITEVDVLEELRERGASFVSGRTFNPPHWHYIDVTAAGKTQRTQGWHMEYEDAEAEAAQIAEDFLSG